MIEMGYALLYTVVELYIVVQSCAILITIINIFPWTDCSYHTNYGVFLATERIIIVKMLHIKNKTDCTE